MFGLVAAGAPVPGPGGHGVVDLPPEPVPVDILVIDGAPLPRQAAAVLLQQ